MSEFITNTQKSAIKKEEEEYRNYKDAKNIDVVSNTYKLHHMNQTLSFVMEMKQKHLKFDKGRMTIWEALDKLDCLVDESDPDADFAQIYHAMQTGEELRMLYPDIEWMPLVGLIHDLGKILSLPEYGGEPQWAVVGDTYPVGCQFSSKIVCPEFLSLNPDYNDPRYNTQYGIYEPNCGLENLHLSWGHDEYLYQVCVRNGCIIPKEGLNMIRFHSFYPWHNQREYSHLLKPEDEETLKWVLMFNKGDLYSKREELPDVEALKPFYANLIDKYFPNQILEW
jgi:inositol oxygenase